MRITSTILLMAACALSASIALAADEAPADKYQLKDGSTLYVHPDGTMRMVDAHGKAMSMHDGEEMALADGRLIMMKNKFVWVTIGPPGKGSAIRKEQ